jgi:tRNA threonylcarbamoyladenosine biosynthesis protein TsaE
LSAVPSPSALVAHQLALPDESASARLGALLAQWLAANTATVAAQGFVLWLSGDLGAGKTTIVRALLRTLGVTGAVKSPSFSLLEPYVVSSLNFYHFDFYRFSEAAEFDLAGFRELLGPGAVCAIEWPEKARGRLPTPDLALTLSVQEVGQAGEQANGRSAHAAAYTEAGAACLQQVIANWTTEAGGG